MIVYVDLFTPRLRSLQGTPAKEEGEGQAIRVTDKANNHDRRCSCAQYSQGSSFDRATCCRACQSSSDEAQDADASWRTPYGRFAGEPSVHDGRARMWSRAHEDRSWRSCADRQRLGTKKHEDRRCSSSGWRRFESWSVGWSHWWRLNREGTIPWVSCRREQPEILIQAHMVRDRSPPSTALS